MAINQVPGVGPQNSDIANTIAVTPAVSAQITASVPSTSAIAAALPTNSSIANAVAAAVPTNSSIANAVAAAVPSAANIQNIVTTYGNLSGGLDFRTMTAQQTFNTSSNNVSTGKNWVYALIAGGGGGARSVQNNTSGTQFQGGGGGGGVAFGMVPSNSVAVVGAGGNANGIGGYTTYGGLRANGGTAIAIAANSATTFPGFHSQFNTSTWSTWLNYSGSCYPGTAGGYGLQDGAYSAGFPRANNADQATPLYWVYLMTLATSQFQGGFGSGSGLAGGSAATGGGGGGNGNNNASQTGTSGGNSLFFSGGAGGTNNVNTAGAGGGGGAGISGAGNAAPNVNTGSTGGNGGNGGNGGGGGGTGGSGTSGSGNGVGGSGAVILYY